MLTPQEIDFLYEILDQVNVRGVEGKVKIVTIMNKLLLAKEPKPPNEAEETE